MPPNVRMVGCIHNSAYAHLCAAMTFAACYVIYLSLLLCGLCVEFFFLIVIFLIFQILNVKPGDDDYLDTSFLLRQASPYMKIKYSPYNH